MPLGTLRRRQPGTLLVEQRRARACSGVGAGPLKGLAAKSGRPSLSTSTPTSCCHERMRELMFTDGSVKYCPYPPRTTVRSVRVYANPTRGAMLFVSLGRPASRNGSKGMSFPKIPVDRS